MATWKSQGESGQGEWGWGERASPALALEAVAQEDPYQAVDSGSHGESSDGDAAPSGGTVGVLVAHMGEGRIEPAQATGPEGHRSCAGERIASCMLRVHVLKLLRSAGQWQPRKSGSPSCERPWLA